MAYSYSSSSNSAYSCDSSYCSNSIFDGAVSDATTPPSSVESSFAPASFAPTIQPIAAVVLEGSSESTRYELDMLKTNSAAVDSAPTASKRQRNATRSKRVTEIGNDATNACTPTTATPISARKKRKLRHYNVTNPIASHSGPGRPRGSKEAKPRKPYGYWKDIPLPERHKLKRIGATDEEVAKAKQHFAQLSERLRCVVEKREREQHATESSESEQQDAKQQTSSLIPAGRRHAPYRRKVFKDRVGNISRSDQIKSRRAYASSNEMTKVRHQSTRSSPTHYSVEEHDIRQEPIELSDSGTQDTMPRSPILKNTKLFEKDSTFTGQPDTLSGSYQPQDTEFWDTELLGLEEFDLLRGAFDMLPLVSENYTDTLRPQRDCCIGGLDCPSAQSNSDEPCHLLVPDVIDWSMSNKSLALAECFPAGVDLQLPLSTDLPTSGKRLPMFLPASRRDLDHSASNVLPEFQHCLGGFETALCMSCNVAAAHHDSLCLPRGRAMLLPSCSHYICPPCLTERYGIKGGQDCRLTCPLCDSFVGFLVVADTVQQVFPMVVGDLLARTRSLSLGCFANQPIIVDKQEAVVVLGCIYHIVAQELGTELALGTTDLPTRPLYWSLDRYFKGQQTHDVTTPDQLRTALLNCIEVTAIDELRRAHGYTWVKRQIGYRKKTGNHRYGWLEMTAALESNISGGTPLTHVMRTWTSIVSWVVGVLTLRWEQRLGFLLGSVNL